MANIWTGKRGTYIQAETFAGPNGAQTRKGRAIFPDGKVRAFRAGIPDTFFSIPAHARIKGKYVKGYVTIHDIDDDGGQTFYFHVES